MRAKRLRPPPSTRNSKIRRAAFHSALAPTGQAASPRTHTAPLAPQGKAAPLKPLPDPFSKAVQKIASLPKTPKTRLAATPHPTPCRIRPYGHNAGKGNPRGSVSRIPCLPRQSCRPTHNDSRTAPAPGPSGGLPSLRPKRNDNKARLPPARGAGARRSHAAALAAGPAGR